MSDLISRQDAINVLRDAFHAAKKWETDATNYDIKSFAKVKACLEMLLLPSVQPSFDITVKIDKAYDDGYEAGYLQGRHDWGDLDE